MLGIAILSKSSFRVQALIREFMSNRSLKKWLYPEDRESGSSLNLVQRLNIVIGITTAMAYLYHDSDPPIVHLCDSLIPSSKPTISLLPSSVINGVKLEFELAIHAQRIALQHLQRKSIVKAVNSQALSLQIIPEMNRLVHFEVVMQVALICYLAEIELDCGFGKSNEPTSNPSSTRVSSVQPNAAPARKHVFPSSLNSASPLFYPSSSSNQDVPVTQKRDFGVINKTLFYPFEENFSSNFSGVSRGKNVSRSNSQDRNYIDDSIRPVVRKSSNLQSSGFSPQRSSNNQVVRVSQQAHVNQRPTSRASSTDSSENGELDSPTGLNKSKTALVGKGKTQSSGMIPSFLYNGCIG
ncbi:hypothetical protein GIB67_029797 [Kingdonia uniflora]|uniref:Uncharacterized protein n=1 Tax=Kingdonia uniflora TaxID=39325 RepID=A0A7J7NIW4_9MAGN|nr:hypothetical protein GIB67_029797 [Kingdonia uniflora]